jgi:hypothetical protein
MTWWTCVKAQHPHWRVVMKRRAVRPSRAACPIAIRSFLFASASLEEDPGSSIFRIISPFDAKPAALWPDPF